ncbi:hypothetical protein PsYK624_089240 [Phanerochaete sordida]|uniref:Uncharacterized protein n=1 Tax=Phanerochaete sordida TaxID=48140 RepID=A0A9P3GD92_9APHY|nr:hypothetical protein PsYK624_089240 [Phanerochaete sordida]
MSPTDTRSFICFVNFIYTLIEFALCMFRVREDDVPITPDPVLWDAPVQIRQARVRPPNPLRQQRMSAVRTYGRRQAVATRISGRAGGAAERDVRVIGWEGPPRTGRRDGAGLGARPQKDAMLHRAGA